MRAYWAVPWHDLVREILLELASVRGPGKLFMHIALEERELLLLSSVRSSPRSNPHVPILRKEWNCILLEEMLTIWPNGHVPEDWLQQRSRGGLARCVFISRREGSANGWIPVNLGVSLENWESLIFKILLTFMISEPRCP